VSDDGAAIIWGLLIGAMIGIGIGCILCDNLRQDAVDTGHAEWRIITGTRGVEFKWKEVAK